MSKILSIDAESLLLGVNFYEAVSIAMSPLYAIDSYSEPRLKWNGFLISNDCSAAATLLSGSASAFGAS